MATAAQIIDLFTQYGGRAPTDPERVYWEGQLNSGVATLDSLRRAVIDAPSLGGVYLPRLIGTSFRDYGGRAPTAAETAIWMGWIRDLGATPDTLKRAVMDSASLGGSFLSGQIKAMFAAYGGRPATDAEVAIWKGWLHDRGDTMDSLKKAIIDEPSLGGSFLSGQIKAMFAAYGGRGATDAEVAIWKGWLHDRGDTMESLKKAIIDEPSLGGAYLSGQIKAMFAAYGGRAATDAEVAIWKGWLHDRGDTMDSLKKAIIDEPSLGGSYLSGQIKAMFAAYGGRPATDAEVAIWKGWLHDRGDTMDSLKKAIIDEPSLGGAFLSGQIKAMFAAYGGRAATDAEVAIWKGWLHDRGDTMDSLKKAIIDEPSLGGSYLSGQIKAMFAAYGGRAATDAEVAIWKGWLHDCGDTMDSLKKAIIDEPSLGGSYLSGQIKAMFAAYGGRPATDAEVAIWKGWLHDRGDTMDSLKKAIIDEPSLGGSFLSGQISLAMAAYGGRAPTADELAQWIGWLSEAGSIAGLHDALVSNLGQAYWGSQLSGYFATQNFGTPSAGEIDSLLGLLHSGRSLGDAQQAVGASHVGTTVFDAPIYTAYQSYAGRAPTVSEYLSWRSTLTSPDTAAATLKASIAASAAGQTYLAAEITEIFQQTAGRAPSGAELATWKTAINNGTATFETTRTSLLGTIADQAHVSTAVTAVYSDYLGRAPTAAEQNDAVALISASHDIAAVSRTIFTSADGIVKFFDTLGDVYSRLLGRNYTEADQTSWFNAVYNRGISLADIEASLMLDPSSNAVRYAGTPGIDTITVVGSPTDVVVSQFDPVADTIRLDASLAGVNLLDAAHAREISIDGMTPEVLIQLNDHQTLLLHGVHLSQLTAADFVFG